MKKSIYIIISIIALLAFALPSNAQQAFYIYRNDGAINTFITTEIDSMTYSKIDVDSVMHDEYVVHEVYTPDSIYRIPIERIDSVGFVTPETVYQPGVTVLEGELRSHIASRDDMTLVFKSSTPAGLLPKVGDKLVSTIGDEIMESAFIGKVAETRQASEGTMIVCEPVALTDVFKCYYGIIRKTDEPIQAKTRGWSDGFYGTVGTKTYSCEKQTLKLLDFSEIAEHYKKNDDLPYSVEGEVTVSLTPTIDYNAYMIVNPTHGIHVSVTAVGNYIMEEELALSGNFVAEKELPLLKPRLSIPNAFIDIFLEFGVFAKAEATVCTEHKLTQTYKHVFHWEWSSKNHENLANVNNFNPVSKTYSGNVTINGSLSCGAFVKIGIAPFLTTDIDVAHIDLRLDGGISLEGTFVPYKSGMGSADKNTALYNRIKDCNVDLYWFYGLSAEAKLFDWSVSSQVPNFLNIPFSNKGKIKSFKLVPSFSDTRLIFDKEGNCHSFTNLVDEDFLFKPNLGFKLINQGNENDVKFSYDLYDYKGSCAYNYNFGKVTPSKYTVYPLIKVWGFDMLAEPTAEAEWKPSVEITDVEVISAQYSPDHFTFNDDKYAFKYNCTVKPTLSSADNVEDWGYVYVDQSGRKSRISCAGYGVSDNLEIEDRHFVCYKDEPASTARLYGYVKYKDSDKYYDFEDSAKDFEILYPQETSLKMTGCNFQGTETDVTYQGDSYKYKSTYRFSFNASGAYWLKVGTEQQGTGWEYWTLPNYTISPADGNNVLTVNYYYNDKTFNGKFETRLYSKNADNSEKYITPDYVTYTYSDNHFDGCTVSVDDKPGDTTEQYEAEIDLVDRENVGDLLLSIGDAVKFKYDDQNRLTEIVMEDDIVRFTYEPFSMTSHSLDGTTTYSHFRFNKNGYVTSFKAQCSDGDSWTETIDYDSEGHPIRDEQLNSTGRDVTTMTWRDGNLIKYTLESSDFDGTNKLTETLTPRYGEDDKKIENKAKQVSYSQIMSGMINSTNGATGVFGKTYSENLPISVEYSIISYDVKDEPPYTDSGTLTFSYEFNNNGSIAKEIINGYINGLYSLDYLYGYSNIDNNKVTVSNVPNKVRRNIPQIGFLGKRRR